MTIILGWIDRRLSAGHCGVYHVCAWPQWSARLCSAFIPAAATQEPPLHNHSTAKHHPQSRDHYHSLCFYPHLRAKLPVKYIHPHLQDDWGEYNDPQCVIYLLCSLSPEMNSSRSPQRKIGDKAGAPIEIQHRKEKSVLTAEKSD